MKRFAVIGFFVLASIGAALCLVPSSADGTYTRNQSGSGTMELLTALEAIESNTSALQAQNASNATKLDNIISGFHAPKFYSVTHSTVTITGSVGSTTVLAANAARKYALIVNSTATEAFLSLTGTATTTGGIPLYSKGSSYELNGSNLCTPAVAANCVSGSSVVLYVTEGQ
jgi:hypothetical protein